MFICLLPQSLKSSTMRKSVVLLACFLVVTVGVLGTLFFAVWVPPSDSAKTPAPELKTTKTNPPVHKKAAPICPNNGVSAPQATGTCSSPVATLSLNGTLCSPNYTASVQCDHLNGWSLQEAAFPTDVVEQVLSNANMFGITVHFFQIGCPTFKVNAFSCLGIQNILGVLVFHQISSLFDQQWDCQRSVELFPGYFRTDWSVCNVSFLWTQWK